MYDIHLANYISKADNIADLRWPVFIIYIWEVYKDNESECILV